MDNGTTLKEPYLQAIAASAAFAEELTGVFAKYGVRIYGVEDTEVRAHCPNIKSLTVEDWLVSTTFKFGYSLRDFQKCNSLLLLQGVHRDQA